MLPCGFRRQVVLPLALLLALGLASAYAISNHTKSNAALQALADDAALAGINSLAVSTGLPAEKRIEASVAATKDAISGAPAKIQALSTSIDRLTISVVIADTKRGTLVSSTARYIPPSDGAPSEAANLLPKLSQSDARPNPDRHL
jgi:hypothetical protein